jgi:hypothetical protein
MSRSRHNWAILCPAALEKDSFTVGEELSALMGDERVPYEADRVLLVRQEGDKKPCGCGELIVHTLKDRTGPVRTWHLGFFGQRFFVAMREEIDMHDQSTVDVDLQISLS